MAKNTKKRTVIYSNVKENKKLAEERAEIRKNQINLNDEVIIGFNSNKNNSATKQNNKENSGNKNTKKVPQNKKNNKNTKKVPQKNNKKVPQSNRNTQKAPQNKKAPKKSKQKVKMDPQKKAKIKVAARILICIIILVAVTIGITRAPVFNIKEISINVENNNSLTAVEIKELSSITDGQNIFTIKKGKAIKSIKQNSHVESVKIKRALPNKLEIKVVERSMKFQIEANGKYIFVDAYGIVIDQAEQKRDGMVIKGIKTENIVNGEKLSEEDLKGLSDAMIITQEAKNNGIDKDITKIDISNKDDYLMYFDAIGKVAHLGDTTSISDKMVRVAKILEKTVDYEGEIFVNVDLNNKKYPYFREKV